MSTCTGSTALRVGVDVLDRRELDRLTRRPWFLRFGYAPGEVEEAAGMGARRRSEFLSGRFAAKEAVLKALGHGLLQGVAPSDIWVVREEGGAPRVVFLGEAARMGLPPVSLSISHKENVVVAVALCVRGSGAPRPPGSGPNDEKEVGVHEHHH
ncbi:holo-ACP synthase [Nocardiopsis quinghaiensis]|uniref:holo-ACP synthase n=1 Tax=Nocardiopsis quinghaiensis TaxID=464995 RepID=UPI001CC2232E|nr:4'-phosphopantetheinyl transferase superfamily protein [Nocardiopsis quinghaiensis]